jgi:site-specific recombinase XerC
MTRGRRRKLDPTMPKHIDPTKLPAGLYWRGPKSAAAGGAWWRYVPHPEGGRLVRKTVAGSTAVMSELHAIMEADTGLPKGTVARVFAEFEGSSEFKALASGTQKNYRALGKWITAFPTRLGVAFGQVKVDRLTLPIIQRLVETIAQGVDGEAAKPTKANHVLRLLRRTFAWGVRHGECATNPAQGARQVKERKQRRVPTVAAFRRLQDFARERGALLPHTKGSVAPYLASVMEIAYAARLRGIEVVTLTDAHALEEGLKSNRRKGSLDNVTRWNPALRAAWDDLVQIRTAAIARVRRPVPLRAEDRVIVVAGDGYPLTKSGFDSAWQRLMKLAIAEGVVEEADRFGLHGLKHRGVTDTPGTRHAKKDASGHRSDAAFDVYDHEMQVVEPAAKT